MGSTAAGGAGAGAGASPVTTSWEDATELRSGAVTLADPAVSA
jgi:hypothetical protein